MGDTGTSPGLSHEDISGLAEELACPFCRGHLEPTDHPDLGTSCRSCGRQHPVGPHGFLLMGVDAETAPDNITQDNAGMMHQGGPRVAAEYLVPWLRHAGARTVLDAGCGVGSGVAVLNEHGFAARGVDLPGLGRWWKQAGNDPTCFIHADVANGLPFRDGRFDAVVTLGVVEHVGTLTGHSTLGSDYRTARRRFARELLRVTRPGGRILVACPNKHFPVDAQHPPGDELSRAPWRTRFYDRTHLNLHRTWGAYHLPSYREVHDLFLTHGGARSLRALPLRNYFGFNTVMSHGFLAKFLRPAQAYLDHLPAPLRRTPLNPYVLAEVLK